MAWTGGLSRPLVCPTDAANGLNARALQDFHAEHYVPGKMVLAGVLPGPCAFLLAALQRVLAAAMQTSVLLRCAVCPSGKDVGPHGKQEQVQLLHPCALRGKESHA